ncbi:P-loop containing nucleoside triphosphate hydrolase protein [Hyaloraphidium curvatum]|nr:P-loop containing nucleoside triphosphate hydrolase protein [Hyaloraphidium curvatum]
MKAADLRLPPELLPVASEVCDLGASRSPIGSLPDDLRAARGLLVGGKYRDALNGFEGVLQAVEKQIKTLTLGSPRHASWTRARLTLAAERDAARTLLRKLPAPENARIADRAAVTSAPSPDRSLGLLRTRTPNDHDSQPVPPPDFPMGEHDPALVRSVLSDILTQPPNVRWSDIAGLRQAKQVLEEAVVLPLWMPEYFKGIRRPWKGVLLYGPPGTGKTLLAKAVATECGTTFFACSVATLGSKWRGESEKLIRILFEVARHKAPSTVFIDELEALCSKSDHEAARRVRSELLTQMDGVATSDARVVLLAATNFPWEIDEAMRRRLEKRIYIPPPDREARLELFKAALDGVQLASDADLGVLADRTEGYSGSDVANICRDASMAPMRRLLRSRTAKELAAQGPPEDPVAMADFESALERVHPSLGAEEVARYRKWGEEYGSE